MNWIVPVTPDERDSAKLSPETLEAASAALHAQGCVVLRGLFDERVVDAMHRDYVTRYGGLSAEGMREEARRPPPNPVLKVGSARYEITARLNGELGAPSVFANAALLRVLEPTLGAGFHLNSFSVIVSFPGAKLQHIHRDYDLLFEGIGAMLPAYAVNVGIPLVDVDLDTGPTGVWPGSHRLAAEPFEPKTPITTAPLLRGDCMLHDFRLRHAGLPNRSDRSRPVLYMSYARRWFFDEVNHRGRRPVDLSMRDYDALPESCRGLLVRALSQALRER